MFGQLGKKSSFNPDMARLLQVKTTLLNSIKTSLLEGKSRMLLDFNSSFCLLGRGDIQTDQHWKWDFPLFLRGFLVIFYLIPNRFQASYKNFENLLVCFLIFLICFCLLQKLWKYLFFICFLNLKLLLCIQ